ncbi:MAG: amidohydrolase family protein [Bacillota bacterium]
MPKRIITALDLEMAARLGNKEFMIGADDVVTDVALERAAQLEIRIIKNPVRSGSVSVKGGSGAGGTAQESLPVAGDAFTGAALPPPPLSPLSLLPSPLPGETGAKPPIPASAASLASFQGELEQIKKEIAYLKGAGGVLPGEADLVIKNGYLVIPRLGVFRGDLEVSGRKIAAISVSGQARGKKMIDATGLYVLPGVVDPHIHLGIFGDMREEMEKETASALLGGVTAAGCMLYSEESYFDYLPSFVEMVERHSYIDIFPHLIITTPRQVEEIPAYIKHLQITSFKIFMCGIPGLIPHMHDDKILDVFEKVKGCRDVSIAIHAENSHIVERSTAQHRRQVEQDNDLQAWSLTRPSLAEEEAVKRAVLLARSCGVTIYLVHLSARESIEVIRRYRERGGGAYSLYAETTSPYLTIDTDWLLGARGKMTPPFRSPQDREALWQGLREGIIDTVGTDNATLTLAEKMVDKGMAEALPGYPALATHLPSLLSEGVNRGRIDLTRLAEVTSLRPAEIFGFYPAKGSLLPGSNADIVVVDLQERRKVDPLQLASRSDFSLYEGKELTGWPVFTVKSGEIVMQGGELLATAQKKGMVIRRSPSNVKV